MYISVNIKLSSLVQDYKCLSVIPGVVTKVEISIVALVVPVLREKRPLSSLMYRIQQSMSKKRISQIFRHNYPL